MVLLRLLPFRLLLAIVIFSSCLGCDQATKTMARRALRHQPPRSYLADTIRLDYAENPGGFLSLGASLPESFRSRLFIVTNGAMMLAFTAYLIVQRHIPIWLFVSIVCIVSGGVGNLIDRMSHQGLVTDFLNVGIGSLRTGVFNVADIAITFGAIAMGCLVFRRDVAPPSDRGPS